MYLLLLVCCALGTLAYRLRSEAVFACPGDGYGANRYMADCNAPGYGDYDHGAFWFGLEPEAARAAANAEVLFLGSSRMQFAFSTAVTDEWFSALAVRYYLLGFSHTDNTVFAGPLLARLRPQARVYVVNVDRFFDDRVTPPAKEIFGNRDTQARYEEKRLWQFFHRSICTSLPALCGRGVAFFRLRESGGWQLRGSAEFKGAAVSDGPADDRDRWERYSAIGRDFLSRLPVNRDCVVLTIVPYEATKRLEAQAIAGALELDLVAPQLDGLHTFDGSHLDPRSAQRWATAFFEAAGPRIRRCLGEAAPSARQQGASLYRRG